HGPTPFPYTTLFRSVIGRPSTRMRPLVGMTKPAAMLSSVDLPQPLAPSRHTKLLDATSREKSWTAIAGVPPCTDVYSLVTCSKTDRKSTRLNSSHQI